MKSEQAMQLVKTLGLQNIQTRSGWVLASCPFAAWKHPSGRDGNPSFGINVAKEFYNCFSCNSGGSVTAMLDDLRFLCQKHKLDDELSRLAKTYEVLSAIEEQREVTPAEDWTPYPVQLSSDPIVAWPDWMLDSFVQAHKVPRAVEYLQSRRIGPATIEAFDIRYDTLREAVVFPVRDRKGRFVGLRGRHLDPDKEPRYHDYKFQLGNNTAHVWFNEHRIDPLRPVVLVEGVFDLIAVWKIYRNVLSPLSAQMPNVKIKALAEYPEVHCFFDNDAAGNTAYEKVRFALHQSIPVRRINYPENVSAKDPGEIADSVLSDLFLKNRLFDQNTLVR